MVEEMGGHFNAYTTRELTTYYTQCFKQGKGPKKKECRVTRAEQ
jgi:hypothetical protein